MAPMESPQTISTVKLPMLKKGEYTLWSISMEQYLTNTDYSLWQLIMNGDEPVQTTKDENGIETEVPPKTAQALLQRQKERKAKSTLLLDIPDEYQLRFHGIKDAKTLQLEIHGSAVLNDDVNQKFLRALPLSWNNIALIMRNKKGIDELDIDAHNNDPESSNSPQLDDEDLEQIDHDDLEEIDLKWECRAPRNQGNRNGDAGYRSRDNTRRTVLVETSDALVVQDNALIVQDRLGYDWSYIAQDEPTEFALMAYTSNSSGSDTELGLESVESQLVVHQKNEVVYEEKIAVLEFEVKDKSNAITRLKNHQLSAKDKTGYGTFGDQLNESYSSGSELFNSVFDSRSSDEDDNQTNDRFKKGDGYHAVPPPLTGNYMPPLADLSFAGLDDSVYRSSEVLIEDWNSDDEDVIEPKDLQTTVLVRGKLDPFGTTLKFVPSTVLTRSGRVPVSAVDSGERIKKPNRVEPDRTPRKREGQCRPPTKEREIRYFNNITFNDGKSPNVPNTSVKLLFSPISLEGAARIWLEKGPLESILTNADGSCPKSSSLGLAACVSFVRASTKCACCVRGFFNKSQPFISFVLLWNQSQPLKILGKGSKRKIESPIDLLRALTSAASLIGILIWNRKMLGMISDIKVHHHSQICIIHMNVIDKAIHHLHYLQRRLIPSSDTCCQAFGEYLVSNYGSWQQRPVVLKLDDVSASIVNPQYLLYNGGNHVRK
ncbi:hypothetical protein Tco_1319119 [Tanacetum coccineum]